MSLVHNLFQTRLGQILVSFIWGIGLALLFFHQVCKGPNCVILKAPPPSLKDNIYAYTGNHNATSASCYSMIRENSECDKCPIKSLPGKNDKGGQCHWKNYSVRSFSVSEIFLCQSNHLIISSSWELFAKRWPRLRQVNCYPCEKWQTLVKGLIN